VTVEKFEGVATREGRWWIVRVEGIGVTQTRRLQDGPQMARELIAASREAAVDDIEVSIRVDTVEGYAVGSAVERALEARVSAADAEARAAELTREVARDLADRQIPLRDIGVILGISHQRAHQLIVG
jgi:hypothetical protein